MKPLRGLSARPELLVDHHGVRIAEPFSRSVIGLPGPWPDARVVWATPTNIGGGLSRRYVPAHPPGETATFAMSFDDVVAAGVGLTSGTLTIRTNVVPPVDVTASWTVGAVTVRGRALYATVKGGVAGTDYQFTWTANDTDGNIWPRTGLCLCATTS
jgi:hypothetical protein